MRAKMPRRSSAESELDDVEDMMRSRPQADYAGAPLAGATRARLRRRRCSPFGHHMERAFASADAVKMHHGTFRLPRCRLLLSYC